ncbi:transcription-repair coupling factor [Bernardetia sp.]|uniref:transcription-repair coupling factor n=1 Tax=Bernardetia sp. TaxID=1937974 RepID=UPI0025BB7C93|nr:transcription-repair coupling factor [Bernardetia sp.]
MNQPETQEQTEILKLSPKDFIKKYQKDGVLLTLSSKLEQEKKQSESVRFHLKGLQGSQDAVVLAAIYKNTPAISHFVVMDDAEEAAYFYNDIQHLLGETLSSSTPKVLFFPTSYKKPYKFEKIDNANVLQRSEILTRLNNHHSEENGLIIVTYPSALTEKVINKQTLAANTFVVKVGEIVETDFVIEILNEYGFVREEYVYEAGQYSVRGGIIDVFSYSNEYPFRIEFFGNEVESIRTFNPTDQLSIEKVNRAVVVPNVTEKVEKQTRENFLEFVPKRTRLWLKDYALTVDVVEKYFERATEDFDTILQVSNYTQIISDPEELFITKKEFKNQIEKFIQLEFGRKFRRVTEKTKDNHTVFEFDAKPQPTFHKNLQNLVFDIEGYNQKGYQCIIAADLPKQIDRMHTIFEEKGVGVQFYGLNIGLRGGFIDNNLNIVCYTDHQIFERYHRYSTQERFTKSKALTLKELNTLQAGDFVTHIDYGIGRFAGLEKLDVNGNEQEAVRLIYRDNDVLYVSVHSLHKISKHSSQESGSLSLSKLGSQEWSNKKKKVKKQLKDIGTELIKLYAKRQNVQGFAFPKDNYMQAEVESSFFYQDTPDQATATQDVKEDMEKPVPMDRLICGDVGFGKTEIAVRAAFKAVSNGKQVAVLVPTTVLAAQHYRTFNERLGNFGVNVDYINRFRTAKEVREILQKLSEGKIDILVGTHKIVGQKVKFKDLGLFIVDEEQKFGVKTKDRIKEMRVNVDCLTLTATPIPRTLQFSLLGARDLSVMHTPPPNRQPVTTEVHNFNEALVRDAISYELRRGGQVFFVHNRVIDIYEVAGILTRLVPDAKVVVGHGQMKSDQLEKTMMNFINGDADILVSTNIIESGLDIPNANTIIINNSHLIGLSDLHQMRGRVGRSNKKAFCYLLIPSAATLPADSRKRLKALEEFNELGDGFKIAMRDLDIRGAGNLLGAEQSGFINDLGLDAYHKLLEEAVAELKEEEFKELFQNPNVASKPRELNITCSIETDLEILIPESYISNISERLQLYIQADSLKNEEQLEKFKESVKDRFGTPPDDFDNLLQAVRLRWLAEKIGFEKLIIKNEKIRGYFVADRPDYYQSDVFGKVLQYVQTRPKRCKLKDSKNRVIFIMEQVKTLEGVMNVFKGILE